MLTKMTPPFPDALAAFSPFVANQGFSSELVWVFREDVTNCGRDYWVHLPLWRDNAVLAEQYYEQGRRHGLGVTVQALCKLPRTSACYVWFPKDEIDASYAMQGPLKLTVPTDPIEAKLVRSYAAWLIRRSLNRLRRHDRVAQSLPSRREVRSS
jgi:hypothetical protein